jgi:hypothetical protein
MKIELGLGRCLSWSRRLTELIEDGEKLGYEVKSQRYDVGVVLVVFVLLFLLGFVVTRATLMMMLLCTIF